MTNPRVVPTRGCRVSRSHRWIVHQRIRAGGGGRGRGRGRRENETKRQVPESTSAPLLPLWRRKQSKAARDSIFDGHPTVQFRDDGIHAALRCEHRRAVLVTDVLDCHAAQQRLHLPPILHLRLRRRVSEQLAPVGRCRVRTTQQAARVVRPVLRTSTYKVVERMSALRSVKQVRSEETALDLHGREHHDKSGVF